MVNTPFEIAQLRAFVAVAEELNFRRAAVRLNLSQPPLTRQIQQLEHLVGVPLFHRTRREVRLTAAGQSFLYEAVDLLRRAEAARLAARQAARGEAGSVAFGFVPSAAIPFLPRIARDLARSLPAIRLQMGEMASYEQIEALLSGRLDLGLTRLPRPVAGVEALRVVREPFVLAAPRDHPLLRARAVSMEDLHGADFISFSAERGGVVAETLDAHFRAAGIEPAVVQAVSQTHSVIGLVDAGLGVALLPASSRSLMLPNLAFREIALPDSLRSELFLARGPTRRNPAVERVAERIVATLAEGEVPGAG